MELKALSQHEHALKFRAHRNQVLTANIANADTPNYKARDLDFNAALKQAQGGSLRLTGTNERHLGTARAASSAPAAEQLKYREAARVGNPSSRAASRQFPDISDHVHCITCGVPVTGTFYL